MDGHEDEAGGEPDGRTDGHGGAAPSWSRGATRGRQPVADPPPRRTAHGRPGPVPVVLRPAHHQEARLVGPGHRQLPVPRWSRRRLLHPGRGGQLTGRPALANAAKVTAATAIGGSLVALVHDLGRPARFVNMLRVFGVTSPMSVGSWLLAGYAPLARAAAASAVTGLLPGVGRVATWPRGLAGPAVATYTAPLIADTAVPVWHEAHRELPFVFAGSAACAASGLGLIAAPPGQAGPARRLAVAGAAVEYAAVQRIHRRLGPTAEPLHTGRAGRLMRLAQALTITGAVLGQVESTARTRWPDRGGGRRFGVVGRLRLHPVRHLLRRHHLGRGPHYTVAPQRARLDATPS